MKKKNTESELQRVSQELSLLLKEENGFNHENFMKLVKAQGLLAKEHHKQVLIHSEMTKKIIKEMNKRLVVAPVVKTELNDFLSRHLN